MSEPIRTFESGATRDSEAGKFDYEGFLSPAVLKRFAAYMDQHRVQADGSLRASDNWQKGMGRDVYMKSGWRHFMDWWILHRGGTVCDLRDGHAVDAAEALCGLLFNVQGYLHTLLSEQSAPPAPVPYRWHTDAEADSPIEMIRRDQ
jgi:hypothetical protein